MENIYTKYKQRICGINCNYPSGNKVVIHKSRDRKQRKKRLDK